MDKPIPTSPSVAETIDPRTADPMMIYRRPSAQPTVQPVQQPLQSVRQPIGPAQQPVLPVRQPVQPRQTALPVLPAIADYWPDARPGLAAQTETTYRLPHHPRIRTGKPTGPARVSAGPPGGSRRRRLPLILGLTALLAAGTATVVVEKTVSPGANPRSVAAAPATTRPPLSPAARAPAATSSSSPRPAGALSGPVGGRSAATFELVSDTTALHLRTAALGADLYQIRTATGSAALPRVTATDTAIRLFLSAPRSSADTGVDVILNSRIRWRLVMTGGVRDNILDLAGASLAGVDLNGGATRVDLTVPQSKGTTAIRLSGGAGQLRIHVPGGLPVRVLARRGAGKVIFSGRTDNGVARGATFTSPGFATSSDRIDVDAIAGVGALTVDQL